MSDKQTTDKHHQATIIEIQYKSPGHRGPVPEIQQHQYILTILDTKYQSCTPLTNIETTTTMKAFLEIG